MPFCSFKQNNETFSNVKTTKNNARFAIFNCQFWKAIPNERATHRRQPRSQPPKNSSSSHVLDVEPTWMASICAQFCDEKANHHVGMYLYTFIFSHTEPHLRAKRLIHPLALSQHRPRDAKQQKTRRETAIHSADLLHPSILHFSSRIDSTTVTSVSSARSLEEGSLLFTAADFER